MNYQLVLQFSAQSIQDFDRLVVLEDRLIEELGEAAVVDGHDFGQDQFNIFVLTDDPHGTFSKAHRIVSEEEGLPSMRSAYRALDGEDYVVLWPAGLSEFRVF